MGEIITLVLCVILLEIIGIFALSTLIFLKTQNKKSKLLYVLFLKENLKDLVIVTIIFIVGSLLIVLIAIIR